MSVIATASAQVQYRKVRGRIIPRDSPEWYAVYDRMEVTGFAGDDLRISTFYTQDVNSKVAIPGGHRTGVVPGTKTIKIYKEDFVLAEYPSSRRFHVGDVIDPPIAVIRFGAIYDYGVDYIPPTRKLTPEEAAAAKAQAAKKNGGAEAAKLKFDEEQAEDGKDLYQYRMGVRYLKGDGVPIDTAKAIGYLSKSAEQGNQDAKKELAKLSTRPPAAQTNDAPAQTSAR